jgi:hypothetical membrane protein
MARPLANPYHGRREGAAARFGAWAGVCVPPVAAAVLLAAGWLTPGYDALRTTVSHLGQHGQPFAVLVNLTFAALGLAYAGVAWTLARTLGRPAWGGAGLLAVAGAAFLGVAIISRDPAHPVPHRVAALALFLALALAPLVLAGRVRRPVLSVATFAASTALLVAGVVGVVHGGLPAGAWERAFVGLNLAWLVVVAAGLARGAGP